MAVKHCTIAFLIGIFIHHLGTDAQTTTLQVRVAGNGQVILSLYNTPGALCSMTAQDAAVICGSIGAQRYGAQVTSVYLPAGSKIWLNALNCNGNEATVEACPKQTWNPGSCPENRAAAVSCRNNGQGTTHRTTLRLATPSTSSNSILTVRLQGASSELTSGRVVVSYYGEAGRVCAEGFDFRDAKVVCRMLGYSTDDARVRYETPAGGKIWLTALDCRGDEQSLLDCGVLTWSPTTCNGQDAGVICRRGSVTPTLPAGFVRLDGGPDSLHGRVYIETVQGTGSVCSGTFSVEEVAVVCRMLTGSPSGGIILAHLYGPGSGTAISTNFRCRGSETNLNQCPYESGSRRCYHAEDISIGCGDLVGQGQVPFSVSLVGGPTKFQGRVEITYYGQTGTVCDNRFGVEEARIVCRLLNYHGDQNTIRVVGSRYGPGPESTPILLSDLDCRGYENNFADCPNPGWRKHDCRHSQDVSIECGSAEPVTPSPTPTPTPRPSFSQVSLTGGADYKHGILNIQSIQDGWQTVCSNSFSTRDLAVVCRMITGRPTTGLLFGHLYGPGTYQPVWDNFNCRGSETNINQCPHEAGTRTCDRLDAISIGCGNLVFPGQSPVSVALVDGPDGRHGRLVINYYGRSGTVCGNSFGTEEARIVCRMLGYNNQYDSFYVGSQYGPGPQSMPVLLDRLECRGYEATLADCQHSGWNQNTCSHRQDVSIHCGPTPTQSPTPSTTPTPRYSRISLRDGPDYLHGILTIESAQGGVQTVCSNGFSAQDLAVVCRMLTGRSTPGLLLQNLYGLGRFQIVSLNFRCRGSETNLNQCPYDTGSRNCYPPAGISISCGNLVSNQAPFSVSLVGGPTQLQGRLQVSYYGQVGTVCNNLFGVEEARVVCRSLGYYDPYDVYVGSDYGSGPDSMPILLDRLICTGSESTFAECQSSGWGTHSCTHRQDVSIQCGRTFTQRPTPSTTPTPTYSRISLTGGPDYLHGILTIESAQGGVQTVCSNSFSAQDLAVVCRMLTGRSTSGLLLGKLYGRGQFQQVPLNFRCRGSETNLNQCPYETGSSNCYQQGGISISCGNLVSNQAPFSMSLVGGPTQLQGRLQVTYYGQVGTVCNNLFGVEEARVVCRSLGYYDPYSVYVGSDYGPGPDSMPILLDRLTCTGSESMLSECQSSGWGTHSCTHRQDVSIQCGRTQTPQPTQPPVTIGPGNAQVSLVKGPDRLHGILTIKSSQGSGTVCNSNFGAEEANVVCRMLTGRSTDAVLLDQLYGPGTGPVVSLNIDCRGTEFNINQCPYGGRPETCRHSQDISIGCGPLASNQPRFSVSLENGPDRLHGRLHVTYYGETGTVCANGFDIQDAWVVCRMLGYTETHNVNPVGSRYGRGSESLGVLMSDINCLGTESSLNLCSHPGWRKHRCTHNSDVSIHCGPIYSQTPSPTQVPPTLRPNPVYGRVFLVDGPDRLHGRIMVQHNNENGTICDDQFGDKDARVVCRMLGYYGPGAISAKNFFGPASAGTRIWMNNLGCDGTEQDVMGCKHGGWDTNDCQHHEDVGALCGPRVTRGPPVQVFLVGGPDRHHGRLLVEYGYTNGTVCDDDFDNNDAKVVCRMLGYSGPQISVGQSYGEGSGKIWLTKLMCVGDELSISDCFYPPWGQHDCDHAEDVGVSCGPIISRP